MAEIPTRTKAVAAAMSVALKRAQDGETFVIDDVVNEAGFFSDSPLRTTRRALRDLELLGYVERETEGGHTWQASDRAAALL